MPKYNLTKIQLPAEKPDCCALCPLVGIIPKHLRKHGSYETLVCIGTMEALTKRKSEVRASEKDSHHPLHRPCDNKWDAWMQLPERKISIGNTAYLQCRIPYEQTQQLTIKFHK